MVITDLLFKAFYETLFMVFGAASIGVFLGVPLGVVLYNTSPQGLKPCKAFYQPLSFLINGARSIPYIILTVLLIPFTRKLIGTSIGTSSAIVPLSIAAALLITRCVEDALQSVPKGLSEVGISIGATPFEIIRRILLPESMASLIAGVTTVMINLVGYSAMAGTVGGGGLGDLAIRYGYQRYDTSLVILIVAILVTLVQGIQMIGQWSANQYRC